MQSSSLRIEMLGDFSIRRDTLEITDSDNRSHKVWLLLAYLICCRSRAVTQDDLVDLLWGESESSSNPANALKTMLHRVRSTLNQLGGDAGHELIIRKGGNYAWNTEIPFSFDVEEFESLVRRGSETQDSDKKLDLYLRAIQLYKGDFLPKLDFSPWVMPLSAFFHNLYLETVMEALPLLEGKGRQEDAVALCRRAIAIDPYHEPLYQHLMEGLMALGQSREAATAYETMSRLLFEAFGVMPSDESLRIFRRASQSTGGKTLDMVSLREQLLEPDEAGGAQLCDYDFFKLLCKTYGRTMARSGDALCLGLLSVTGEGDRELPRRSLDCCMENLRQVIRETLREGDAAALCSVSQYTLLLPHTSYEAGCAACQELVRAFCRKYPHSPARLHFTVQPLLPQL